MAEEKEIAVSEQELANILGYQKEMKCQFNEDEQKTPDQNFAGLEPGSIVSLLDRKVFRPTNPVLKDYYLGEQGSVSDHLR